MRGGLAVFDEQGKLEFRNPFWENFCAKQEWSPTIGLVEFAAARTGSVATSADISLSALQPISSSLLVTIPLAGQSAATAT